MKKILFIIFSFFIFHISFASNLEDDSIIKELNNIKNASIISKDTFKLKKFKSCLDMQKVLSNYVKDYWETHKNRYIRPLYRWWDIVLNDASPIKKSIIPMSNVWWAEANLDYSKTNTQVKGVDESDIIKTDWSYIYYYNKTKKYVYIIDARNKKDLKIFKKLRLPKYFYNVQLYVDDNKLVILASWNVNWNYTNYYFNRNSRTFAIIFDIKDKKKIKLDKIYIVDWTLSKSRKIWNFLYIVSNNYFSFPYYNFKKIEDIKLDSTNLIPRKIDISRVRDIKKANLKLKWKLYPYKATTWNVAKCNEIEYIFPDKRTLEKYDFRPSYNIITTINLGDTSKEAKTKVIAWNNDELYMSTKNMYLISKIYSDNSYKCKWDYCIMPYFYGDTTNTLIHKFKLLRDNIEYKTSNLIPGRPLNQYSMDEKDDKFRIITSTSRWNSKINKSHTDLFILDDNLKLYSKLENIWTWERFQSARFMWNKLFLVTFKQIDPLFVIDLKDEKNPKIIWELKIPGYSTYLHPYDENHLIWLGYDTKQAKWWGTINGWIKLDLYEINYNKKLKPININCNKYSFDKCPSSCVKNACASACPKWVICISQCIKKCENPKNIKNQDNIEVKRLYSLVMWEAWSYSEALRNPRMFMWNKNKNILFLPVTLYYNEKNSDYKRINFFQGLEAIKIDKDYWIKELYKITHINTSSLEEKRKKECSKYFKQKEEKQKCRKLLDWSEYCPPKNTYYYIPEYCFADTPIWAYIAAKSWSFRNEFIKRALWIWNWVFAISDEKVTSHNINNWVKFSEVEMK